MDITTYQYIEDNGGGLYLFVFAGGMADSLVAGIANLENAAAGEGAELQAELQANAPEAVRTWDGHLDIGAARQAYKEFCADDHGSAVIADNRGIYADRMGAAGKRYFGITEGGACYICGKPIQASDEIAFDVSRTAHATCYEADSEAKGNGITED